MKAPEKIYLLKIPISGEIDEKWLPDKSCSDDVEYIRKDAFIEKACEFLKSYRQDTPDGYGYIAGIVNDKTIEDFKNYMKG